MEEDAMFSNGSPEAEGVIPGRLASAIWQEGKRACSGENQSNAWENSHWEKGR